MSNEILRYTVLYFFNPSTVVVKVVKDHYIVFKIKRRLAAKSPAARHQPDGVICTGNVTCFDLQGLPYTFQEFENGVLETYTKL